MQIIRSLFFVFIALLLSNEVYAQTVSARGIGSVSYGFSLGADERAEAQNLAKKNALETYIAESGPAKLRLFEQRRDEFLNDIDRYVLSAIVISDQQDKNSKTYQVVVRAEINSTLIQSRLDSGASVVNSTGDSSLLAFIFVARSQDSVKSFDDRVYKRAEGSSSVKGSIQQSNNYSEKTKEGESFGGSSISTSGSRNISQSKSTSENEKAVATLETGGSTTKKSEKVAWKVSSASEVNTVVAGLFSAAGYEVAEAEYVEGIDLIKIRNEFGTGDDLSPLTLRAAAKATRAADVKYLAFGTLDVGMRDTDPVSGNTRIYVTVTSKVLDVSRQIPRVVSSVGPMQYAGLGPNETVARTNALQEAASKAAQQMANELNAKSVN